MFNVHIQSICEHVSILRVYKHPANYPDDGYELAATILHIAPQQIEIVGVDKPVTLGMARAIAHYCRVIGLQAVWMTSRDPHGKLFKHAIVKHAS